jgi:hypothetical protein
MPDRPIIFSAPMIRALLDGRKTQTRRLIPERTLDRYYAYDEWCSNVSAGVPTSRQFEVEFFKEHIPYAIGDRLWVKEGFQNWPPENVRPLSERARIYRATDQEPPPEDIPVWAWGGSGKFRWHSPIHMPRWASRLTLTVTDVRVQRLNDISEADARAESCEATGWQPSYGNPDNAGCEESIPATDAFAELWTSIHGPDAWDRNPWVVALSFTVRKGNIDA